MTVNANSLSSMVYFMLSLLAVRDIRATVETLSSSNTFSPVTLQLLAKSVSNLNILSDMTTYQPMYQVHNVSLLGFLKYNPIERQQSLEH